MLRQIILINILLLISFKSFGQKRADSVFIKYNKDWTSHKKEYITDTVVFESGMFRNILIGTTKIPSTHNQNNARGYGLYFNKVLKSDCLNTPNYKMNKNNQIESIISTDSSILININIYDNCCYDFLCDISVDTNSTLNLSYYGYGTYCSCNCCFGLTYVLDKINSQDTLSVKDVIINGDRKTLKIINNK